MVNEEDIPANLDPNMIPFRFIYLHKRKLALVPRSSTFEEAKTAVREAFPPTTGEAVDGKKTFPGRGMRGPVGNIVFQFLDVGNQVAYIENQEDWESFVAGPCRFLKNKRITVKVVNKKTRKRARDNAQPPTAGAEATEAGAPKKPKVKKSKAPIRIIESAAYQKANFRGALQEYFQLCPDTKNVVLTFETRDKDDPKELCFISTCKLTYNGQDYCGMGHAPAKKSSVHFAALDVMLKLGLVTPEEHQKIHPPADA